jgi:3-oxoacyl-[acyl-carrier protein] reductase
MSGKLAGKIAVVTGSSKGIGAGIAKQMAAEGASLVINHSNSKESAEKVVHGILSKGGKAVAVQADVSKDADIARLFEEAKKHYGRVDILVNNAGAVSFAPFEAFSIEEYQRLFDTNVRGLMLVTRTALPLFPATGGAIVNISSCMSTMANPMLSVYSATKGAVDSFTKVLAKEFAPRNLRVNAINPGLIYTEGVYSTGIPGSEAEKGLIATIPLARPGTPEDVALPAVFLASDDARYITGETLYVSGGAAI